MSLFEGIPEDCPVPGGPEEVERTGREIFEKLKGEGLFDGVKSVVDIGCGVGRLAPFIDELGISYHGYDPLLDCIQFAKARFPCCRFTHIDIRNSSYNPRGAIDAHSFKLLEQDRTVDCVIASSLFTHLGLISIVTAYLTEIHRVLCLHGRFCFTCFTSPPNATSCSTERTVLPREVVDYLLLPYKVLSSWGGLTTGHHDQWVAVLERIL